MSKSQEFLLLAAAFCLFLCLVIEIVKALKS